MRSGSIAQGGLRYSSTTVVNSGKSKKFVKNVIGAASVLCAAVPVLSRLFPQQAHEKVPLLPGTRYQVPRTVLLHVLKSIVDDERLVVPWYDTAALLSKPTITGLWRTVPGTSVRRTW